MSSGTNRKKPNSEKSTQSTDEAPARRLARPSGKPRRTSKEPAVEGAISVSDFLKGPGSGPNTTLDLPGGIVEATNLEKVFWPDEHYTKGDLVRYYLEVSAVIMKYLKDRPAILARYPNGALEKGFFQQNIQDAPALLKTERLENQVGRFLNYAVYTDVASLIYLVNLGTIAQNPWHSRVPNLDRPDYVVFDLDPHGAPFADVLKVALATAEVLRGLSIVGYPKTSGSTGMHVYVPIARRYGYDEVAAFAEEVSNRVAESTSKIATTERKISARKPGQIYVDWQQNARGKSAASVYSVRAKPGATVSTPVTWNEISYGFEMTDFTIKTVPKRLEQKGDLWDGMLKGGQRLPQLAREI
jgi:bifunctional non-homologous end joining protein LigD